MEINPGRELGKLRKRYKLNCRNCGKECEGTSDKIYCSARCRYDYWKKVQDMIVVERETEQNA